MEKSEFLLRKLIRNILKESDNSKERTVDPDLEDDPSLLKDILSTAKELNKLSNIKESDENNELYNKNVKEFISETLDANGKLIALFNLGLHQNYGKTGSEFVGICTGALTGYVSYVINVLSAHGLWAKVFGSTIAGGVSALNTSVGISVALGGLGYWLAKKALKKLNMSSILIPDWHEIKEFKKSINLDEKDLINMEIEELCKKYNIKMP